MNALAIFSSAWLSKLSSIFRTTYYVRAAGNAGESVTEGVTNIPFIEIEDTGNVFNGSQIIMPFNGIVDVTIKTDLTPAGGNYSPVVYIDGQPEAVLDMFAPTSSSKGGNYKRKLNQGQIISFRFFNIGTQNVVNDVLEHWLTATITRL